MSSGRASRARRAGSVGDSDDHRLGGVEMSLENRFALITGGYGR